MTKNKIREKFEGGLRRGQDLLEGPHPHTPARPPSLAPMSLSGRSKSLLRPKKRGPVRRQRIGTGGGRRKTEGMEEPRRLRNTTLVRLVQRTLSRTGPLLYHFHLRGQDVLETRVSLLTRSPRLGDETSEERLRIRESNPSPVFFLFGQEDQQDQRN